MSKSRQLSDAINSVDISESAPADAVTLDASGNLLVGTTQTEPGVGNTNTGLTVNGPNGRLIVSRSTGIPVYLNRSSTDGTIVDLRKDGSTVGSIGNSTNNLLLDSAAGGGLFIGSNSLAPRSGASLSDASIKLGTASYRYTDLYLSGGVYLGGTGAANYLDDYEEGTFDITITPQTSGTITVTTAFNSLVYTKVGRIVHITGGIGLSGVSSPVGTFITIAGLPFTLPSLPENQEQVGFALYYRDDSTGARSLLPCSYVSGTSFIAEITAANIQANDAFQFDFSYVTS